MGDHVAQRPGLLADRYDVGEVIGEGGMGIVHRAWDVEQNRYVAIKVLRPSAITPVALARFSAEGKALAQLSHPGLIALFDAGAKGDEPYLVMELVDGVPLTESGTAAPMAVPEVVAIGAQLAEALDHVHQNRIVHRDVKPSNILICADGRVKLADFGVSRMLDGFAQLTSPGMTMGTAAYLSPEQVRGNAATSASDVYSLGLLLIEMLSGEIAFVGSWEVAALARLTESPPIDPSWPAQLRQLLAAMIERDPALRPTAADAAAILQSVHVEPDVALTLPMQQSADQDSADQSRTPGDVSPLALIPNAGPALSRSIPAGQAVSSSALRRWAIAVLILLPVLVVGLRVARSERPNGAPLGKTAGATARPAALKAVRPQHPKTISPTPDKSETPQASSPEILIGSPAANPAPTPVASTSADLSEVTVIAARTTATQAAADVSAAELKAAAKAKAKAARARAAKARAKAKAKHP